MPDLTRAERTQKSHQKRKHYKGKMVQPGGGPRSHTHGGHSQARAGFTCGDTRIGALPSKMPGLSPYRVTMPRGQVRHVAPVDKIPTGK